MRWRELLEPVRMERIAVVAPERRVRDVLLAVAESGVVELQLITGKIAGEAAFDDVAASAIRHGRFAAFAGWTPAAALGHARRASGRGRRQRRPPAAPARRRTADAGRSARRRGRVSAARRHLCDDSVCRPEPVAVRRVGLRRDVRDDVRRRRTRRAAAARRHRLARREGRARSRITARRRRSSCGAGLASAAFGFAYGEAFGPTGLVPTLWLAPLDAPITLHGRRDRRRRRAAWRFRMRSAP